MPRTSAPFANLQWNIARAQNTVFCDSALCAVFQVLRVRALIFVHFDRHNMLGRDDISILQ
jgi:hypothetical protein